MLALTMGDPAGIGGEIALKAWQHGAPAFVMIADPDWLRAINPMVDVAVVNDADEATSVFDSALPVMPVALSAPVSPGTAEPSNSHATIESIRRAVVLAQTGAVTGVVTNPIAKHVLYSAGFRHPGHTEFLADLTGASQPVMMLANRYLRVVPVTVHMALRAALDALTSRSIIEQGRIVVEALQWRFGIPKPRVAVAGLNPHAGEQGTMGNEEAEVVSPAIEALRAEGIDVSGPWPPDTMFTPAARATYDVALCMYHDQALIPLKTLDMASGVNVTLGLPIVRTSPDHGTAFDIAGRGVADPSSLIAALAMAAGMRA